MGLHIVQARADIAACGYQALFFSTREMPSTTPRVPDTGIPRLNEKSGDRSTEVASGATSRLTACPWGCKDEESPAIREIERDWWQVQCSNGCGGPVQRSRKLAVKAWNSYGEKQG